MYDLNIIIMFIVKFVTLKFGSVDNDVTMNKYCTERRREERGDGNQKILMKKDYIFVIIRCNIDLFAQLLENIAA